MLGTCDFTFEKNFANVTLANEAISSLACKPDLVEVEAWDGDAVQVHIYYDGVGYGSYDGSYWEPAEYTDDIYSWEIEGDGWEMTVRVDGEIVPCW